MSADVTTVVDLITSTAASFLNHENEVAPAVGSGNGGGIGHGHDHMQDNRVRVDHKEHDMTAEMLATAERLHYATSVVVGPIVVILGMIGNILSIIVWTRRHMKSSTGRYLTALAAADMCVLVCFVLNDTLKTVYPAVANSPAYAIFYAYLGYPFFFLGVDCSIWFTVGVTVDRCIMVFLITKAKDYCSQTKVNIGIGLIGGLCFVVNLPHYWSFTVDWERGVNGTGPALVGTEFQKGEAGMAYELWVHCLSLFLVPWFIVLVLNILIISKIGKTNRKMSSTKTAQSADKSRQSENQITRLLLIVTFTFLVLLGFQCITQCFYMVMPDGFDKNIIDELFAVAKLGVVINSSINFALYCVSGRRFRHELLKLLGCEGRPSAVLSSTDHSSVSTAATGAATPGMRSVTD